jgi:sugar lactone lactonase YvrE
MKRSIAFPLIAALALAVGLAGSPDPALLRADSPGTLNVVAGDATPGYSGDGGPATQARLNAVTGLAFDALGNLYIGDAWNHRVRRVDTQGIITTVVGSGPTGGGRGGFAGDDGPALQARLNNPVGLAFDPVGSLYIADYLNGCIRQVDREGIITTVETGNLGGGLACDAAGNLFFVLAPDRIQKRHPNGLVTTVAGGGTPADGLGDGGPATSARIQLPFVPGTDAKGNLYIPELGTHRVRRVDSQGIITTVAGGGNPADGLGDGGLAREARLIWPISAVVDPAGNLFIADNGHGRVRKVDRDGIITTVAGNGQLRFDGAGGAATAAGLVPSALALDGLGNLYIGEGLLYQANGVSVRGHRVVKVSGVSVPR